MRRSIYWFAVVTITALCLFVISNFSLNYRLAEDLLVFSIVPSVPIYFYRRRNEKLLSEYFEKRHDEKS